MTITKIISAGAAAAIAAMAPATAEDEGDKAALLALAEKAFDAVHSQNPDDWRAIQLADGVAISFRQDPDGPPGAQKMRLISNEAFLTRIAPNDHDYRERWTSEPTVMIRGPIAVIWGEFEFTIDGEFSHCGVNSIDAVKIEETWKISNFTWTVETEGCDGATD